VERYDTREGGCGRSVETGHILREYPPKCSSWFVFGGLFARGRHLI